jgi:hypothetical protein
MLEPSNFVEGWLGLGGGLNVELERKVFAVSMGPLSYFYNISISPV